MFLGYLFALSISTFYIFSVFGYQSTVNFTQPHVITSPNYPEAYSAELEFTWMWSKPRGVWAVIFEDIDIICPDHIYIIEPLGKTLPVDCLHSSHSPIYTQGSSLTIRFTSSQSQQRGFKLKVISGTNLDDLKSQVYDFRQSQKPEEDEDNQHIYILLYVLVALILLFLICLVAWVRFIRQRRRQTDGTVSVAVSVNHIRRDSGVQYKRSPSTSDSVASTTATTTTRVDIGRNQVTRTPTQRSWTTRANLATKGSGTVGNLYSPMINIGHYQNQINRSLSVEYDPLNKPVPNPVRHPTTVSGYEAPVLLIHKH